MLPGTTVIKRLLTGSPPSELLTYPWVGILFIQGLTLTHMTLMHTELSGDDLKQLVLTDVWHHASSDWKHLVDTAIDKFARSCAEINSEMIWDYLASIGATTHENRAMGAAFQRAAKKGLIYKTNRTIPAKRKSRHSGDVRVWSSLVYFQ